LCGYFSSHLCPEPFLFIHTHNNNNKKHKKQRTNPSFLQKETLTKQRPFPCEKLLITKSLVDSAQEVFCAWQQIQAYMSTRPEYQDRRLSVRLRIKGRARPSISK
jgi:hypothetical protein